ncbi:hypothetical protein RZS08_30195, partial [Arthrospira platensis SPKY1]|nr:hypothetical protein [Arthrospira platensis SPKY1]
VFELGGDIDAEVDSLPVSPNMAIRVDLPLGTRLLLVSGDETYELVVRQPVSAGATSVPIQETYITAYTGAKVLFDNAYFQSQLLVQPDRVYAFAQSVDGKATSALTLATTNESAIASLQTSVTTANSTANS